jgi:hypothetical protein
LGVPDDREAGAVVDEPGPAEPNWLTPVSFTLALKSSKEPNALLMASASSPSGSPPPSGLIHSQNSEWL